MAGEYKYTNLEDRQIRIAHLYPGNGDGNIYVEISKKKLEEQPDYSALSWEWGSQELGPEIRMRDRPEDNPGAGDRVSTVWHKKRVKPNLFDALKRLRNPDDEVRLWIDAICIQQLESDGDAYSEKSKQISMMTDIYKRAKEVKVWLGEPKQNDESNTAENDITRDDVEQAVQDIDRLGNLDDSNHIAGVDQGILKKAGIHNLDPLFKLLRRGWFSRRWVVQEVSVNRNVEVHCGEKTVSWKKLAYAVALLERVGRDGTINRILKMRPETNHVAEYVGNISALPAYRLVQNKHALLRMRGNVEVWEQTLEQLVCFLAVFQASYAHDTIYAILGIVRDFTPTTKQNVTSSETNSPVNNSNTHSNNDLINNSKMNFEVDYSQEPLQVFKRFLKLAIAKSRSLDILCRPWAPVLHIGKKITFPSWILNLERKPFQATKSGKMIRYNPDPLVGPAIFRLKFFNASGLGDPTSSGDGDFFDIDVENEDSRHIIVRAFELSKIKQIWDAATFGNIPSSWLEAGGWKDEKEQPPDELWRTLVADRTCEGTKADPWYPMAFQSAVREKELRHGINTAELIHEKNNAAYSEAFRRVQAVVTNRKLIRTQGIKPPGSSEEESYLGLVPENAQVGDLICIVLGCSVPLVLRVKSAYPAGSDGQSTQPQQNGKASNTNLHQKVVNGGSGRSQQAGEAIYEIVGECYVDDMMDGQALALSHQWAKFKIE